MKQSEYKSTVWVRTDRPGLVVSVQGSYPGDTGVYFFNDPSGAVNLFENLIKEIKNAVGTEDLSFEDTEGMLGFTDSFNRLFCNPDQVLVRMKKVRLFSNSVAYCECDYEDNIVTKHRRRMGQLNLKLDCFVDEPPEYISIRMDSSVSM